MFSSIPLIYFKKCALRAFIDRLAFHITSKDLHTHTMYSTHIDSFIHPYSVNINSSVGLNKNQIFSLFRFLLFVVNYVTFYLRSVRLVQLSLSFILSRFGYKLCVTYEFILRYFNLLHLSRARTLTFFSYSLHENL